MEVESPWVPNPGLRTSLVSCAVAGGLAVTARRTSGACGLLRSSDSSTPSPDDETVRKVMVCDDARSTLTCSVASYDAQGKEHKETGPNDVSAWLISASMVAGKASFSA